MKLTGFKPFEIMYYDKWFHISIVTILYDTTEYSLFAFNIGWDNLYITMQLFFLYFFIKKAKDNK